MESIEDVLKNRKGNLQFRQAAELVLGMDATHKLDAEWNNSSIFHFGLFLAAHHHGVFIQLVAYMKVRGKW